jgi:hypothetical protein
MRSKTLGQSESVSSRLPPIGSNLFYTQKQSEHSEKSIREAQNSG